MREPCDRTEEGKTADGWFKIGRSDFCNAFEQDPGRFSRLESAGTVNRGFWHFYRAPREKGHMQI